MFLFEQKQYLLSIFLVNYVFLSLIALIVIKTWETGHQTDVYSIFSKKKVRYFIAIVFFFIGGLPISGAFYLKVSAFLSLWKKGSFSVIFLFLIFNLCTVLFYFNSLYSLYDYTVVKSTNKSRVHFSLDSLYYFTLALFCLFFLNLFGFMVLIPNSI